MKKLFLLAVATVVLFSTAAFAGTKEGLELELKQLAVRDGKQEYRQALCTQCFSIGRIITDSRFVSDCDVGCDNDENDDEIERKKFKTFAKKRFD